MFFFVYLDLSVHSKHSLKNPGNDRRSTSSVVGTSSQQGLHHSYFCEVLNRQCSGYITRGSVLQRIRKTTKLVYPGFVSYLNLIKSIFNMNIGWQESAISRWCGLPGG